MLALTHVPSPNLACGQRTHVARVAINHDLAVQQHRAYCAMLRDCGAEVYTLDQNRDLPDSTFVEDAAIVLDEVAVLASMGTEARRRERAVIATELKKYRELHSLEVPATIEGGDVLRVGRTLLVGLSSRTSSTGIQAFEAIVRRYGYRATAVHVRGCLHFKTACTALPDGTLLLNPSWLKEEALKGWRTIRIPEDEPWAANTLRVGDIVCIAAEYVRTIDMLRRYGCEVRTVNLSEFAKAEGGVTCLSLLIGNPMSITPAEGIHDTGATQA
jgi:dimethylargininase